MSQSRGRAAPHRVDELLRGILLIAQDDQPRPASELEPRWPTANTNGSPPLTTIAAKTAPHQDLTGRCVSWRAWNSYLLTSAQSHRCGHGFGRCSTTCFDGHRCCSSVWALAQQQSEVATSVHPKLGSRRDPARTSCDLRQSNTATSRSRLGWSLRRRSRFFAPSRSETS